LGAPIAARALTGGATFFVGRQRELAELAAALAAADAGNGGCLLVSGEAGIGKTRLVEELSRRAAAGGARVLWGRCWEGGGAPPFWPWIEILRPLIREAPPGSSAETSFARLIPQLASPARGHEHEATLAPLREEHERFLAFDAVTSLLADVARTRTLLVVLDDVHAGDLASLLLLEFAARRLRDARILFVATSRSFDTERNADVTGALTRVARQARSIPLGGLSQVDVASFLSDGFRVNAGEETVSALHHATAGNPFFLDEVVRLVIAEGGTLAPERLTPDALRIPTGVREATQRRLEPFSSETRNVLATASLIGRELDVDLLEAVTRLPRENILAALAEPEAARLIVRVPNAVGRWAFAHGLVRSTLFESLSPAERARRHRRIAEAMVTRSPQQPPLAEIARHFCEAAVAGLSVAEAVEYCSRAGEASLAQLAYEDAAAHFRRALHLLERSAADEPRRCRLLTSLGNALARAGDGTGATDAFAKAVELARRLDDSQAFAEAALGYSMVYIWPDLGRPDDEILRMLEEALHRIDEGDSPMRAALLARLCVELYWTDALERRRELGKAAVAMARRVGVPSVLAYALSSGRFASWGPGDVVERLAIADEVVSIGDVSGQQELALRGRIFRVTDLLDLGDFAAAEREIAEYATRSERLQQPFYQWHLALWRAMTATLEGRLDEAERLALRAFELGQGSQERNAAQLFGVQTFVLAALRGRVAGLEPALAAAIEEYPANAAWRCALAYVHAETGEIEQARADLERLAEGGFSRLPRDAVWLTGMSLLGRVCATLHDAERARTLYEQARPFANRSVVIGPGAALFGPMSLHLGVMAATAGLFEDAQAHYLDAIARAGAMGALPYVALAEADLAALRLERRAGDDLAQAAEAADRAAGIARRLGMEALAARAEMLGERARSGQSRAGRDASGAVDRSAGGAASRGAGGGADSPGPTSRSATEEGAFRREGDYWTIEYEGRSFRLHHADGLAYIARLLAHPGVEIHVLDLMMQTETRRSRAETPADASVASSPPEDELTVCDGEAALPILDETAQQAYVRRLEDVREELREASAFNDTGRVAKAQREIDFLTAELARARGLGGRSRVAASSAERARVNVTKRIKLVIRRIEEHDPSLARYLATTIHTGSFCCYTPDPRIPVEWRLR
jgi:tetratricopeptide (TPR) repeat protein